MNRPCPVCHTTDALTFHHQSYANGSKQALKRCFSCTMIYADSALTQQAYDITYREHSKYIDFGNTIPFNAKRHQETVEAVAAQVGKDAKVLDVGCATGELLQVFRDNGFTDLTGYDASPACRDAVAQRGFKVIDTTFDGFYDCITLSHVLEHIYDVRQAMANIVAMMTSTSVLYIEVPDVAQYDTSSGPFQDFNTEHVNHFTWQTLVELGKRWGLTVLQGASKQFPVGDGNDIYDAIWITFAKERIFGYVEASQAQMKRLEQQLEQALKGESEVIVWGAGQLALKLLTLPVLADRVKVAWDGNPALRQWIGTIPVEAPGEGPDGLPIVIASVLNVESIKREIAAMGLKNRVVTLI